MAFDKQQPGNLYVTDFSAGAVTKFDASGNRLGTFGSGYNSQPESILFDAAGDAYVGQAAGSADILQFDGGGQPVATYNVPIEDRGSDWIDLAVDQGHPGIGVDGAGNVLVSWTDERASPSELRVRRRPAGGAWLPSTVVAADDGIVPSLAVRADGHAFVAWQDAYCYLEYPGVWGARYDPVSTTWSAPERIDTNGPDLCATNPSAALDTNKTIVVWSNSLNVPSGENNDDVVSRVRAP